MILERVGRTSVSADQVVRLLEDLEFVSRADAN